jgi:hypothetical protein
VSTEISMILKVLKTLLVFWDHCDVLYVLYTPGPVKYRNDDSVLSFAHSGSAATTETAASDPSAGTKKIFIFTSLFGICL